MGLYKNFNISMKKTFVIIAISILIVFLIILVAGIYKFNFTNDDIYSENDNGEIVPYNGAFPEEGN